MHLEVLVEDQSGGIALEILLEKILGANGAVHSWKMRPYKGIGRRLPNNLSGVTNPSNRILLDRLPSILKGYGRSLPDSSAVMVVLDSDDKDCQKFKQELLDVLNACNPRPIALFKIAVEESEAWLLGDRAAVKIAYPNAKNSVLDSYVQDSICGTWKCWQMLCIPAERNGLRDWVTQRSASRNVSGLRESPHTWTWIAIYQRVFKSFEMASGI